jgi:hypothetical protein
MEEQKYQVESFSDPSDVRFSKRKIDKRWERMKKAGYAEIDKFKSLTYATYNAIEDIKADTVTRLMVDEMLDILIINNPPYLNQKNPAALILSYSCIERTKDKKDKKDKKDNGDKNRIKYKINMKRLSMLHLTIGPLMKLSRADSDKTIFTPLKRIDLVRYARYWITTLL